MNETLLYFKIIFQTALGAMQTNYAIIYNNKDYKLSTRAKVIMMKRFYEN